MNAAVKPISGNIVFPLAIGVDSGELPRGRGA